MNDIAVSKSKSKQSGKFCCLPQCANRSSDGHSLYLVPNGFKKYCGQSTEAWAKKFHQILFSFRDEPIFKKRVKDGKAFICHMHFNEADIIKTSKKSRLIFGVLPTQNLPRKSHSAKLPPPRQKIVKYEIPIKTKQLSEISSISEIEKQFNQLARSNWRMEMENEHQALHFTYNEEMMMQHVPNISLFIKNEESQLKFQVAYCGKVAPQLSAKLSFDDNTLHALLQYLKQQLPCKGYVSVADSSQWLRMPFYNGFSFDTSTVRYFAPKCLAVACDASGICKECMLLNVKQRDSLLRKVRRLDNIKKAPLPARSPLATASRERIHATIIAQRQRITRLEEEFKTKGLNVSDDIKSIIESQKYGKNSDNSFLQEWWSVQKNLQDQNSKFSNRYPPSIVKFCLKLHAKSAAAYKMLQQILVIPSERTLRRERSKLQHNTIGVQKPVVERIKNALARTEKECDRMVVLAFDEMTIKEDIAFSSATGNIVGYVDFDDETLTAMAHSPDAVATHMLAFFLRGITNSNADGVVAFYPTARLRYEELFHVVVDLLIEIPAQTSCIISGLVYDGLSTNRTAMNLFCDLTDDVPYKMTNPLDSTRYIYFLPDPPHTLKTCRNNLLNPNKSLWNNGEIYMEPIKTLIREDLGRGELRLFHKLTEKHISPSSWEKMNVAIAAQTLSETVGKALEEKGFLALAEYILRIDKWFDCMNAGFQQTHFKASRKPYTNPDDPRLRWLVTEFPSYLALWQRNVEARGIELNVPIKKMVLSDVAKEGLLVSCYSMQAIVTEALSAGAEYVLARRINQDPLEAYFGYQRQRGRRYDAPTVSAFASNAKSLDSLKLGNIKGSNVQLD